MLDAFNLWFYNDQNGSPCCVNKDELTEDFIKKLYNKLQQKRNWKKSNNIDEMVSEISTWNKESTEAIYEGRYSFINPNFTDDIKNKNTKDSA